MKQVCNREWLGMAERILGEGRWVRLRVRGSSMRPFLRDSVDEVLLLPVCPEQLRCGHIALARLGPDGRYVLHRIERIEGEKLWLRGDGNVRGGERCRRADVVAIASTRIRSGRESSLTSDKALRRARIWHWLRPLRRLLLLVDAIIRRTSM